MWNLHHPIWYNPHSLTPLLRILDTRVTRVSCMATRRPSLYRPEIPQPDLEVALMETEAGVILRVVGGFIAPAAEPNHWFHILGTAGEVETGRAYDGSELLAVDGLHWLAKLGQPRRQPVRWPLVETSGTKARESGHEGLDLAPVQDFIDSVLEGRRPLIDIYLAANVAAAGALAGESGDQGAQPFPIPDFRPNELRSAGDALSGTDLGLEGARP
jgi:hypothetical protein